MPACTYSASAEIRRPLAICCKISALGLRRPRSIWLRYGFETPAAEESCRSEILACSRCWRMYSPMEPTFMGLTSTVNHKVLAIASGLQAPHRWSGDWVQGRTDTRPGRSWPATELEPVGWESCLDLANYLAAAEYGQVSDLVQRILIRPRHIEHAQQGHGHGRDRPGGPILHLDRCGTSISKRQRLNTLGPGLHQQPGDGPHERPFRAGRPRSPFGVGTDGIGDAAFC